jgi:hypothetical protein
MCEIVVCCQLLLAMIVPGPEAVAIAVLSTYGIKQVCICARCCNNLGCLGPHNCFAITSWDICLSPNNSCTCVAFHGLCS